MIIGIPAISPLAKSLLEENDRLARIGAVETLGRIRTGRAVACLMMALMEPDAGMQDAASQALVRTGRPAVGPLIRMLKVAGNPLRRRAAEVLVRTRGLAVKPLIDALGDENAEVRIIASEALVKIGKPSLGPLMRALNDSNPVVRQEAVTALGLIGDPRAVAPLVRVMKRKDRGLRRRAAEALVRLGKPAAGPLVSLLKETDAGLRGEAAWALAQIGRPAFKPLCQALLDADLGARWEAAQVLSRLRSGGQLRGLHGEWERTVDETLLLAWYNSGWAQQRADGTERLGDSKHQNTASLLMRRLPMPQKRKADQPRGLP
jgi:HEAT repeat protein